ncbi:MAG: amidohydrolase family protein [Balneolaceae bacterium]
MNIKGKNIDRRDFLRYGSQAALAATAGGALAGGRSRSSKESESAGVLPQNAPDFIIDSHIHVRGGREWVEEIVELYRSYNAMACAIVRPDDMDLIADAMDEFPDVFIGYGQVSVDDPEAVRQVDAFYNSGFFGMKFHSPRKNWDDPSYYQVYRRCEENGMHMLFHTGITSRRDIDSTPRYGSMGRMRPVYLDALCRQFPDATIQGAHFGNPWYAEAAECARWNPNLFFDITGSNLYKFIELDKMGIVSEYLWWAGWDDQDDNPHTLTGGPSAWEHMVFGTDEGPSGLTGNIDRFQQLIEANNVPEVDQPKMWGLTMARILGIDPETKRRI